MHSPSWEGGCQSFSEIMDEKMWTVIFSTHVMLHSFFSPAPEPVILPEILVKSSSISPSWCNVTLECKVPGNREDLSVTWESEGLPREPEWSGTPELAPNAWDLTVNLSLVQSSASLTCVVSNHVEKKTASVDFAQVCSHGECSLSEGRGTPRGHMLWVRALGFSPPSLISTTFHRGHPIQEPGKQNQLASALKFLTHPCSPLHPLPLLVQQQPFRNSLHITHHSLCIQCGLRKRELNCVSCVIWGIDLQCLPVWFRA